MSYYIYSFQVLNVKNVNYFKHEYIFYDFFNMHNVRLATNIHESNHVILYLKL